LFGLVPAKAALIRNSLDTEIALAPSSADVIWVVWTLIPCSDQRQPPLIIVDQRSDETSSFTEMTAKTHRL
jgi:hypothetical protein